MIYPEEDFLIDIPDEYTVKKHDDETNGLKCWKSVDFVVELPDRTLFVEFKDPENPLIPDDKKNTNDFITDNLLNDLSVKTRMSFLYEHAMDGAKKPVYYYIVIGLSALDDAIVIAQQDKLKKRIP